jgi:hypothetical protein
MVSSHLLQGWQCGRPELQQCLAVAQPEQCRQRAPAGMRVRPLLMTLQVKAASKQRGSK